MNEAPINVPWTVVLAALGTYNWLVRVVLGAEHLSANEARRLAAALIAAATAAESEERRRIMSRSKCGHEFVGAADGAACPTCAGVSPKAAEPKPEALSVFGVSWDGNLAVSRQGTLDGPKASGPAPKPEPRRVQVGDVWRYGSGQEAAVTAVHSQVAILEHGGLLNIREDGTPVFGNWTLVRAARPKAAVGQRWRFVFVDAVGVEHADWDVVRADHGVNQRAQLESYRDSRRPEHERLNYTLRLVDGTLPEPWEYVGEANQFAAVNGEDGGRWRPKPGETVTIDKPMAWYAPPAFSGVPFPTPAEIAATINGGAEAINRMIEERLTRDADAVAHVCPTLPALVRSRFRLKHAAEAFAFLAAPEFRVHLQRVAVDNAIAACPADLDPVGWRAAVLAYADVQQQVKAKRLDPDTCDLEVVLLDYVPSDELDTADVAARDAYRRATAPSPRVRRRGEALR